MKNGSVSFLSFRMTDRLALCCYCYHCMAINIIMYLFYVLPHTVCIHWICDTTYLTIFILLC